MMVKPPEITESGSASLLDKSLFVKHVKHGGALLLMLMLVTYMADRHFIVQLESNTSISLKSRTSALGTLQLGEDATKDKGRVDNTVTTTLKTTENDSNATEGLLLEQRSCRQCEDILSQNATWFLNETAATPNSTTPSALIFPSSLVDTGTVQGCGLIQGRDGVTPEEALDTLQEQGSILFLGNSVFRRTMFAVAHLAVGPARAPLNPIASSPKMITAKGYQRVYDHKIASNHIQELRYDPESDRWQEDSEEWGKLSSSSNGTTTFWLGRETHVSKSPILGFAFLGTPPEHKILRILNSCLDNPDSGNNPFHMDICDKYDVIAVQVFKPHGLLHMSIVNATAKLLERHPTKRVIFIGVPHRTKGNQQETQQWLDQEIWPSVRQVGAELLDVTRSTYDAFRRNMIDHEHNGHDQHFRDQGRLLMASLVINRLRMGACVKLHNKTTTPFDTQHS